MAVIGSPMSRDHIPALLERGIRRKFFQQYDLRGRQYENIFNVDTSDKKSETDVVLSGVSLFPMKAEGAPYTYDSGQQAWTKVYTHLTYALGLQITREGREDDLYGFYTAMGGELGRAAAYTREVLAMEIFNNLSATVYSAGGSNYTLLSTSHYRVDGGTWRNRPTQAADLSRETLETAIGEWRVNMVDQRGLKINVDPAILLVGPSDWLLAEKILDSDKAQGGNDNDINVIKRRNIRVMVSDFLTDDGRWFLLAPKERTALNFFNRRPTMMERNDDPANGNAIMVGSFRCSAGATHPSGIWGSP